MNPRGELRLTIARRASRSIAAAQFHRGALRVLKPHYLDDSGQVSYTLVNPGGGYLGGDRYELDISVAEKAGLLLTTQSATKIYRTPQGPAVQTMSVRLGPGSVFESLPDPVIVYRDGTYRQSTVVDMDPAASLLMAEIITPGWSPEGQPFRFDRLQLRTEVRRAGRRVLVDNLRLVPDAATPGLGVMEGFSHSGTLMLVDVALSEELRGQVASLLSSLSAEVGMESGLTAVDGGLVIRSLARSTGQLQRLHLRVADLVRRELRGQGPVNLRKS